jgi:histone demethylase JARID1
LKYIASIRPKAEQYGICRIVPPPSWKPPCPLKEETVWEGSTFATRVQRVDKLQNRDSMRKMSTMSNHSRKKRRRCMRMAIDCGADIGSISRSNDTGVCEAESFGFEPGPLFTLDKFQKYADDFMAQYFKKDENTINKGGSMTMLQENCEPTLDNIEGEYWRIVEKATEEIEVCFVSRCAI